MLSIISVVLYNNSLLLFSGGWGKTENDIFETPQTSKEECLVPKRHLLSFIFGSVISICLIMCVLDLMQYFPTISYVHCAATQ